MLVVRRADVAQPADAADDLQRALRAGDDLVRPHRAAARAWAGAASMISGAAPTLRAAERNPSRHCPRGAGHDEAGRGLLLEVGQHPLPGRPGSLTAIAAGTIAATAAAAGARRTAKRRHELTVWSLPARP